MSPRVALALAAWGLGAAVAQDDPFRGFAAGVVRRAGGEPWAGARVRLVSMPWDLPTRRGCEDRVEIVADAKGRFKAALLHARDYSAFAHGDVVDGSYTVCQPIAEVVVGTAIELIEDPRPRTAVRVRFTGLDAWRDQAPWRVQVWTGLDDRDVIDLGEPRDGEVVLPPCWRAFVQVVDKNGQALASGAVPVTQAGRQAQLQPDAADPNDRMSRARCVIATESIVATRVDVPPPLPIAFEFLAPDGKPLAGVEVAGRERADRAVLGRSGADGICRFTIPDAFDPRPQPVSTPYSFWVQCPGHIQGPFYRFQRPEPDARGVHEVLPLTAATRITGRLWWRQGSPAAHALLLVHSPKPPSLQRRNGGTADGVPTVCWTDAEGRFAIDGRRGAIAWQLSCFVRPAEQPVVQVDRVPTSPRVLLASGVDRADRDTDLGDLVLGGFARLDLRVADAGGQPAPRTVIAMRQRIDEPADLVDDRVLAVATDALGQLRVLARPGATLVFEAGSGDHRAAMGEFTVPEKPGEPLVVPVVLPAVRR